MNVISDLLAVAVVRIVRLVRTVTMIVPNIAVRVMAVGACRPDLNGCGMVDFVRRMRMRRRAEEESHSKQKPTKHLERNEKHACWLALECGTVKPMQLLMLKCCNPH
jgi:hypothetical protein